MTPRKLHVISFDVPWPADYGGVIDVYYKLKALHQAGVEVVLHCFQYGRSEAPELREVCAEVHYYPRKTGLLSQLSPEPYIVRSRVSEALVKRLLEDTDPILCEGLHTSYFLTDSRFADRKILVRTTNVEHDYYSHLAAGERNLLKRWFFRLEAFRLRRYEVLLARAEKILAISPNDEKYFSDRFGSGKVCGIYAFHQYDTVLSQPGRGEFFLYHGKLDIAENYRAVMDLLPVFAGSNGLPLKVAGMNPPGFLMREIEKYPAVELISNPSPSGMQQLISAAHGHLLITSQPTGLKLKLLAALFQGRFAIVNPMMVEGTGLESLCHVGKTTGELRSLLQSVQEMEFTADEATKRNTVLEARFSNTGNALKIIDLLKS
ncbi:MAG TPA: glycosyltransferase family 1 protein [Bacteroidales bacterium]|nr:glycosyltransferase family 1 protein [Bacteroidales bacterium]HRZ48978.1 glycosyltransferase family 1 protein [Bacteroidales bacterium]